MAHRMTRTPDHLLSDWLTVSRMEATIYKRRKRYSGMAEARGTGNPYGAAEMALNKLTTVLRETLQALETARANAQEENK